MKQSIAKAFVGFLRDLPKATFVCHLHMFGALAGFYIVGKAFTDYLVTTGNRTAQSVVPTILAELVGIWLLAFALGVKGRPAQQQDYFQYPPIPVLGASLSLSLVASLILGVVGGKVLGFGVFKSVFWTVPGVFAIPFLMIVLFVPTVAPTKATIAAKRNPALAIADSYQRTWIFAATALLLFGCLLWYAAGNERALSVYSLSLHSSFVTAVFITGYASGYYP